MTGNLPDWVKDQQAVREADEITARRAAYDEWAAHYAYMASSDPDARCSCAACNPEPAA